MARIIRGTNGADRINQNGRSAITIQALGGNDTIVLDRDDDLGGDNTVDAGKGNDTVVNSFEGGNQIALGKGNDIYVGTGFSFLNAIDIVDGGAGNDQFFVSTLLSTYIGGNGNDIFRSNGHKNDFIGGNGSDTISYEFRHEDSVVGDEGVTVDLNAQAALTGSNSREDFSSIENAIGSLNNDLVIGSNGANTLMGLAGSDELQGKSGNDVMVGGLGQDFLFGEGDADTFVFQKTADSSTVASARDIIFDFNRIQGDRIDLSGIDADTTLRGNQAFEFIGTAAFTGEAGEVRFSNGVLSVDVNGNGTADMTVDVRGLTTMLAADFIL
ncbi:MAG: hemolysin-type calcium-binding repeat family protein [Rhizobium sp.]|nr:hemolysin-type calcium-binding repeat family protein [Rhizobium sp.]